MKTLITCHSNADCDAFAAMLALRHIYPGADLLFPGTQEAGLNKIYERLDKVKYGFISPQEIDWNNYERLALADTRQKSRVNHVSPLLERDNILVEAWDHHPPAVDDIANAKNEIFSTGSITSALCNILKKDGCQLEPEEATLLGLGIYGDTGSFTYSSTTQDDYLAAAWLLGQGMDVNTINELACHDLTGPHIQALNSLLESAASYLIGGHEITLAETSVTHYLGDFAYLAHKLLEMEKFDVLFALGIMGDKIQIVARSRNKAVNVGRICADLGGGGHAYAASATARHKTITEVREAIIQKLNEQLNPPKTASDYMSSPAIGLEIGATLRDAEELMVRFGLKAIPIFQKGNKSIAGLLDGQTASRGTAHGLGSEPVEEYMQRRVQTLPPNAPLKEISEIIVGSRQRLVPIMEKEEIVGVVTRTDLINLFANEADSIAMLQKQKSRERNVAQLINTRLPAETRRILNLAGSLGKKLGLPVYAVGGFVRDLLLGHSNQDIDLVAEGNGIALARELAHELGGRIREHDKFLTSVVIYHDDAGEERHIDVATARLEYYEYPAALPTVELSSIKMDLFRRDFSINAMAIRLDSEPFGQLVDFFGGQRDTRDKLIRVLHTLSFVEDPTRCIRAVRFEQRYKFRIGPGTEKLIRNILPMHLMEKLSPQRLFHEFKLLCSETTAAECLLRLDNLGILKTLGKGLALNPSKIQAIKRMKTILSWYKMLFFEEVAQEWICFFLALSHNQSYTEASENYDALGLPHAKKGEIMRQREKMRALKSTLFNWQKKRDYGSAKISVLYEALKELSLETLLYMRAAFHNEGLEKSLSLYITQWRNEKADINGDDLKRIGVEPGPVYASLLRLALYSKLDGLAPTPKAQLACVLKSLQNKNVS